MSRDLWTSLHCRMGDARAKGRSYDRILRSAGSTGGDVLRRSSSPDPAQDPIRLLMVEPRPLVGAGVRQILDQESDIEVIAQVGSPDEAIRTGDTAAPDVILVNAAPAESTESEATLRLRRDMPDAAFVVLGGDDDDASIFEAIDIGAMGHVAEVAATTELVATIRRVAHGEDVLRDELNGRPDLVEQVLDHFRNTVFADPGPPNPMTAREIEVLGLVAQGLRNREIADTLEVNEQTIKNHLRAVMHKLGAPNRTRAVLSAIRNEWLAAPEATEAELIRVS
jgi:DNA-binding NarL/FixJ family response regulator